MSRTHFGQIKRKLTRFLHDKFSVICVWKLVVWILSAFSRCHRFSEHELGAKFECDQELGRPISGIDFQLLSSWMCVFVWWKWDEFANDFAPGTGSRYWGRPTDRDQPCQSRTSLYYLDICHSVIILSNKNFSTYSSTFTFLCSLYVRLHYTHCM